MKKITETIKKNLKANTAFYQLAFRVRGKINRIIKPGKTYWTSVKNSMEPLSTKYGIDRGLPIDRFWIEKFLDNNKKFIKGVCLEIGSDSYTKKYGAKNVKRVDILDIDKKNSFANIYGDLRNLKSEIKDETYDCIILTHVLGLIDDLDSAVSELKRITKEKGVVLVTSACISPTYEDAINYWRILPEGAGYLFGKYFGKGNISVSSYGNVLAGQCFWAGMSQEDLTYDQLDYNDPRFPCIVSVRAIKKNQL